ncbi:MAG: YeeE/YedE thiosulfate transporter family protein [Pseudomonadota bacterium]
MMWSLGRVAGISGIVATAFRNPGGAVWAWMFLLGLGAGGWLARGLLPVDSIDVVSSLGSWPPAMVVGGLLVGFGTRLGAGCTSGHGVCGIARFSPRSLVATCTFVGVGMLTATLIAGVFA